MATAGANLRDPIEFAVNVPVDVALKFPSGRIISTRNGERVMFTTADDRVMFLDLGPAQKINDLGVNVREKFLVCKRRKGKEPIEWDVWLHPETEKARAIAEARRDGTAPRPGNQKDGTFVVPALPPAPDPAAPPAARRSLADEAAQLVDAFASVLEYSLTTYQGRVKPDDVRSLLLTVYIDRRKAAR